MHTEEVEVQLHSFLTLALDTGEQSISHPRPLTSQRRTPVTHWNGSWADSTVSPDVSNNRKIYCPSSNSKPVSSSLQPVTILMEHSGQSYKCSAENSALFIAISTIFNIHIIIIIMFLYKYIFRIFNSSWTLGYTHSQAHIHINMCTQFLGVPTPFCVCVCVCV
jgi:hypothetical protein